MNIKKLMIALIISLFILGCDSWVTDGVVIPISNPSFENPTDTGLLIETDDWTVGGSWYGRWRWPEGAKDGECAIWSSYRGGGPENGYEQTLSTKFEAGSYKLSIYSSADVDGIVSRLILGYINDSNASVELDHNDMTVNSGVDNWKLQELVVEIPANSPAIGRNIWIRFTGIEEPTTDGSDSNSWDSVSLLYLK